MKNKYIDFYIGKYAKSGEISMLTILNISIYQRVGKIKKILFWTFGK